MSTIDTYAIFAEGACHFQGAVALERAVLQLRVHLMIPSSVLMALSVEIWFKCLRYHHGGNAPQIHTLKTLFAGLPEADRSKIKEYFDQECARDRNLRSAGIKYDFDSVMTRCDDIFRRLRYMYEGENWQQDSEGVSGPAGLGALALAVCRRILDFYPDWAQRFVDSEFIRLPIRQGGPPPSPPAQPQ